MNVTIFTSSHLRHKYLVKKISEISSKILYVKEDKPYIRTKRTKIVKKYFNYVLKAEKKIFKKISLNKNKIKILNFKYNEISLNKLKNIKIFNNSKFYIIFGSSIIKGDLLKYLVKKRAINIHMGVSPYFRGTDCNFWAIHDNRSDLVGASIILLSKKIDNGKILRICRPKRLKNKFYFMMSAPKIAAEKLKELIIKKEIYNKKINPNKNKLLRYSKRADFSHIAIKKFYSIIFKN